jgi:hypothetical protein
MTEYVGGLRERLIADSVYHLVRDCLTDLGWFDTGRPHKALSMRTTAVANDEEVDLNTLVVNETDTTDNEAEMGSNLGEVRTTFYIDFYAEKESLGKHVIHDIRDILKGRMPAIDRTNSNLPVYDWYMATPALIFGCDLDDVVVSQARDFPKPYQKHWWACRFDVVDYYGGNPGA